ncbi:MAG: nucleotidyltransferase domain-containing protein [Sulfuricurvum sp.]|nr:nucleotidyltransferase domain-containing protein [Sulfuricurvum sp.]
MRLHRFEIDIIKSTLHETMDDAKIFLFGSRIDDAKKGGDIDLFVQTHKNISLKEELTILAQMEFRGIERKIDLIIQSPITPPQKLFETIIKEGILL